MQRDHSHDDDDDERDDASHSFGFSLAEERQICLLAAPPLPRRAGTICPAFVNLPDEGRLRRHAQPQPGYALRLGFLFMPIVLHFSNLSACVIRDFGPSVGRGDDRHESAGRKHRLHEQSAPGRLRIHGSRVPDRKIPPISLGLGSLTRWKAATGSIEARRLSIPVECHAIGPCGAERVLVGARARAGHAR
jgi:hypothetical protein